MDYILSTCLYQGKQCCFFSVTTERWCRLRGNMLFYFKTNDHCSDPLGVLILENYEIDENEVTNLPHSFTLGKMFSYFSYICHIIIITLINILVSTTGKQILGAPSIYEKKNWINAIYFASFSQLKEDV